MIFLFVILLIIASGLSFYVGYTFGVRLQQGEPVMTPSGVSVPERKKLTIAQWEELQLKNKKRIESVFDNDGDIIEEGM